MNHQVRTACDSICLLLGAAFGSSCVLLNTWAAFGVSIESSSEGQLLAQGEKSIKESIKMVHFNNIQYWLNRYKEDIEL